MAPKECEEIELKLELDPRDCDRIDWAALFGGPPRRIRQYAVYFDTPDHALARAGYSLRIRGDGTRRHQTVKAKRASAGIFVRTEWEFEVEGETPVLDARTPVRATLGEDIDRLAPIFTIENARALWDLDGVEIALDQACLDAGGKRLSLCEIEFEAKGCDVAALFGLARRVAAVLPADISVSSKAERAYRLLEGSSFTAKGSTVPLKRSMSTATAFQFLAQSCIRQFRLNVPPVLAHADPEALHQARVALRRLRTAIAVFKPVLAGGDGARWNAELGWLASELGKARDLDVLMKRIGSEAAENPLAIARDAAYAEARTALASPRARELMLGLVEWINIGEWLSLPGKAGIRDRRVDEFAAEALERLRDRLKQRGRKFGKLDDQDRHDVRKAAKKLRYAAEFFAPLFPHDRMPRRAGRFLAALEKLQDELGAMNDLATASAIALRLGLDETAFTPGIHPQPARKALSAQAAGSLRALLRRKRFWK